MGLFAFLARSNPISGDRGPETKSPDDAGLSCEAFHVILGDKPLN